MTRNPETDIGFAPPSQLRELSASVRRLMESICAIDGPPEELARAKEEIDAISERLAKAIPCQDPRSFKAHPNHEAPEGARLYRAGNPRDWDYNPINPPMNISLDDEGRLHARTWLGLQFEGPPNTVHGGIVAYLLDQMLGYANTVNKIPGFTGTLTIRYLRPTPLFTDLDITAMPVRNEDRKIYTEGKIIANGEVTAEAEGLFLRPGKIPKFARGTRAAGDA